MCSNITIIKRRAAKATLQLNFLNRLFQLVVDFLLLFVLFSADRAPIRVFLQPLLHAFLAKKFFTLVVARGLDAVQIQKIVANPAFILVQLIRTQVFFDHLGLGFPKE